MADQQKPTMVMVDVFRPVKGDEPAVFVGSVTVLRTTRRMARASAIAQIREQHDIPEQVHLVTEFHDVRPEIGTVVTVQR